MIPKSVSPSLDYLTALTVAGLAPCDVWASAVGVDKHLVQVMTQDGRTLEFLIIADHEVFAAHYRKAIEYCGFGPRGLSNLIYADALKFSKAHELKKNEVEVRLSSECAERAKSAIADYMTYGFSFLVCPTYEGIIYTFHRKES